MDKNTENLVRAILTIQKTHPDAYSAILNIVNLVAKSDKQVNELNNKLHSQDVVISQLSKDIESWTVLNESKKSKNKSK